MVCPRTQLGENADVLAMPDWRYAVRVNHILYLEDGYVDRPCRDDGRRCWRRASFAKIRIKAISNTTRGASMQQPSHFAAFRAQPFDLSCRYLKAQARRWR
jgi:hypothetical protein